MAPFVYLLCALTSSVCAALLLNSYRRTALRLLFWSGACFVCLAIGNILLFVDLVVYREVDLLIWRNLAVFVGVALLIYGLIFDSEGTK